MTIAELNAALNDYDLKWKTLASGRRDRAFFDGLKPTGVGWKVADLSEFDKHFAALRAFSDQINLGWINERWIATFHLREPLPGGVEIVKLMQLRPGSSDHTGLDHVDFLAMDGLSAAILKTSEPDLNITDEQNGELCRWVSVWFGGTEAKLRSETTLDVCAAELKQTSERIKSPGAKSATAAAGKASA